MVRTTPARVLTCATPGYSGGVALGDAGDHVVGHHAEDAGENESARIATRTRWGSLVRMNSCTSLTHSSSTLPKKATFGKESGSKSKKKECYTSQNTSFSIYICRAGRAIPVDGVRAIEDFRVPCLETRLDDRVGVEFTLHGVGRHGSGRSAATACVEDVKAELPLDAHSPRPSTLEPGGVVVRGDGRIPLLHYYARCGSFRNSVNGPADLPCLTWIQAAL